MIATRRKGVAAVNRALVEGHLEWHGNLGAQPALCAADGSKSVNSFLRCSPCWSERLGGRKGVEGIAKRT